MIRGELIRTYSDSCTIGTLFIEGIQIATLELPDLGNQPYVSCIPEGVYRVKRHISAKLGKVWYLQDVENRSFIYIHKGNYTRQIQGCILVGTHHAFVDNDNIIDVANSAKTMDKLLALNTDEWEIRIFS